MEFICNPNHLILKYSKYLTLNCIPEINLHKVDLVRTKLLIQAHQRQLVQYVKQLYNMDLHIHVSTSPSLNLHMQIHLQHIPTQEQSNTVKCLCPGSDIIGHLEEHVHSEILDLNTQILGTLLEEEASMPEIWC